MASASCGNWPVSWSGDVPLARPDQNDRHEATPHEVTPAVAVMAAALAGACGGTAEARRLTAGLTREITARQAGCVIARNARYGATYSSMSAS
jgi:hypothetical protein